MRDGLGQRGGQQRERGQQRQGVPVYRAEQAREAVEAEPGAPVHVGLEQREGERARDRRASGAGREDGAAGVRGSSRSGRSRWRSRTPTTASQTAAMETAAASASETSVTTTSRGPPAEASKRVVERARRRERVGEPARREHEQRDRAEPERLRALIAPAA